MSETTDLTIVSMIHKAKEKKKRERVDQELMYRVRLSARMRRSELG